MEHINSWVVFSKGLRKSIQTLLDAGKIKTTDIMWVGLDGSVAIDDGLELQVDEDYDEYIERGTVEEFLTD